MAGTQLAIPDAAQLREVQLLAARFPDRATHALVTTENVRDGANALYRSVMQDSGVRTHHYVKAL